MLSHRIKNLKPSGIRKLFDLAFGSKNDLVDFSIGQPHFKVPDAVKRAAKEAIDNDFSRYTPTLGIPELRAAVAKKLEKENGIKAQADNVIITTGTSGGIFLALSAILDPGDEIIIPDPYFVLYNQVAAFLGARIILWDTYPDFQVKPETLASLITPKTKAIIVNSPNNPTGAVYNEAVLRKVARIAAEHGLVILSDEIYEYFDYDNRFFSIGSLYGRTVTVNGFSKSHALTGWRIGYAHGPSEIIEAMGKLQQYTYVCAPALAQAAALAALKNLPREQYREYARKRDLVNDELKDKFNLIKPQGSFFAFPAIPTGMKNFTETAMKAGVLVVPGTVFSTRDTNFRLSYAVEDKALKQGLKLLKNIV